MELVLPSLATINNGNFSGYFHLEDRPRQLSLPVLREVDEKFNVTDRIEK